MAIIRPVYTKFWYDDYIDSLSPKAKLLFLYLLTNPATNLSGIYQISKEKIANDTGIGIKQINLTLHEFETSNRAFYMRGWVCIMRYMRYQQKNESVFTKIRHEIADLPDFLFRRIDQDPCWRKENAWSILAIYATSKTNPFSEYKEKHPLLIPYKVVSLRTNYEQTPILTTKTAKMDQKNMPKKAKKYENKPKIKTKAQDSLGKELTKTAKTAQIYPQGVSSTISIYSSAIKPLGLMQLPPPIIPPHLGGDGCDLPAQAEKPVCPKPTKPKRKKICSVDENREINSLLSFFYDNGNAEIGHSSWRERRAAQELIKRYGLEQATEFARAALAVVGRPYAPVITNACQLRDKLASLKAFYARNNSDIGKRVSQQQLEKLKKLIT